MIYKKNQSMFIKKLTNYLEEHLTIVCQNKMSVSWMCLYESESRDQ